MRPLACFVKAMIHCLSGGISLKMAHCPILTSRLLLASIGWAIIGNLATSANGQVFERGRTEQRREIAVLETTSQSSVPRSILPGGRPGFLTGRNQVHTTVQVYPYAAPPAPAHAFQSNTTHWPAPLPSPPGLVPGFNYHSTWNGPIPAYAHGAGLAHPPVVIIFFASPTPATQFGTWTDGAAPMIRQSWGVAPPGLAPSAPWNGQTCPRMESAAFQVQQPLPYR